MNGGIALAETGERSKTRIAGNLVSVRCRQIGSSASLEAELYDGCGVIRLVWMGQRRINGIEAGRTLTAEGMLGMHRGRQTMFNPRYQLGTGPGLTARRAARPAGPRRPRS
jgi:hypothetical protein